MHNRWLLAAFLVAAVACHGDGPPAVFFDRDGDGYTDALDCDDTAPLIFPGATEWPHDGVDQDCDGQDGFVDLTVVGVSLDNAEVTVGSSLQGAVAYRNEGNFPAGPFQLDLVFRSEEPGGGDDWSCSASEPNGASAARASAVEFSCVVPWLTQGPYQLSVRLDSGRQVEESNENNNVLANAAQVQVSFSGSDSYLGWETYELGFGAGAGFRSCSLYWAAVGAPITSCDGCAFAFEVELTLDSSVSTDDGSCAELSGDASYAYGYVHDYCGYGPHLMVQYGSQFYALAPASFDGTTFSYERGVRDYPYDYGGLYPGYYVTDFTQGWALVY